MTHPLTDKISDKLYEEFVDSNFSHWDETDYLVEDGFITTQNLMQIGADWQLKRVIRYLENDLEFVLWSDSFMDKFKKAMRPQQQEDN